MKYIVFRLSRQWMVWVAVILSIIFVLIYSYRYTQESYGDRFQWSYDIKPYKSAEDIDAQIKELQDTESELGDYEYELETKKVIKETIAILEYLKANNFSYSDVSECVCSEYSMDRLSYVGCTLNTCFIFQGLAAILLIGQIVNAGLTTGASVSDYLVHGRKKVFKHETYTAGLVLFSFCLFQILLTIVFSLFLPENTPYMLAYTNDGIRVMTRWTAILLESLGLPVQMLVVWAGLYLISRLADNILAFSIFGGVYFAGIYFFPSVNYEINEMLFCAPSNASVKLFLEGFALKLLFSVIMLQISYVYTMRRRKIGLNLA